MTKRASTRFLMWVTVISLHAHLSIAAVSKSNGTTSVCDGSVQDCLIVHHLDSQLPTISSSHFRRILAGGTGGDTYGALKASSPVFDNCQNSGGYRYCGARRPASGSSGRCDEYSYDRNC